MNDTPEAPPRLWITYPWTQREEGNFSYLVSQLKEAGIQASYDAVEIRPDISLWQIIERKLESNGIDGWAYVLTPLSMMRRTCTDELVSAFNRLLREKGAGFPLIGLLHGVAAQNIPALLRVRPCFHLTDPEWKLQVAATFRNCGRKTPAKEETRFLWKVHEHYGGDPEATAIEVGPRRDSIPYWRFAVPKTVPAAKWGQGPRGGGEISPIKFQVVKGSARMGNSDVQWFGAANAVSVTESAYAVFSGRLPEFVCFGPAKGSMGPPDKMEMFRTGHIK